MLMNQTTLKTVKILGFHVFFGAQFGSFSGSFSPFLLGRFVLARPTWPVEAVMRGWRRLPPRGELLPRAALPKSFAVDVGAWTGAPGEILSEGFHGGFQAKKV